MKDEDIVFEAQGAAARLTINRPSRRNALTDQMLERIEQHCAEVEKDDTFRALIITGAGEKSFSAGGDIQAWGALSAQDFGRHWVRDGHRALDRLARLSIPVIAVLNGDVYGGGLELAATADYRIAESHICIGQPEPGLGIIPGWSGTQRAVRRFGASVVRRMALFGEVFDAEQALALGLVDRIIESGEGMAAATQLLETLQGRSPAATELTKALINSAEGEEQERVVEFLAGMVAASGEDLKTGLDAFKQKKKPDFR